MQLFEILATAGSIAAIVAGLVETYTRLFRPWNHEKKERQIAAYKAAKMLAFSLLQDLQAKRRPSDFSGWSKTFMNHIQEPYKQRISNLFEKSLSDLYILHDAAKSAMIMYAYRISTSHKQLLEAWGAKHNFGLWQSFENVAAQAYYRQATFTLIFLRK